MLKHSNDLRRRRVEAPETVLPDEPDPTKDTRETLLAAQIGDVHALLVILFHLSLVCITLTRSLFRMASVILRTT